MSRSKAHQEVFTRHFDGMAVVDADSDLLIVANNDDVSNADKANPQQCAIALACRRLYGSMTVLILRSVAYVELPAANGVHQVVRYELDRATRDAIVTFDKTGVMPEAGFRFRKPSPSFTLDALVSQDRKKRKKRQAKKRQALLQGETVQKKPRGPLSDPLTLQGVRHGAGMVQFPRRPVA